MTRQGLYDFLCSMDAYIAPGRQLYEAEDFAAFTDEIIEIAIGHVREAARDGLNADVMFISYGKGRRPEVPNCLPIGLIPGTWSIASGCYWDDETDDARYRAWSGAVFDDIRKAGTLGTLWGNMQQIMDVDRLRQSFGEAEWRRLTEIKRTYDPTNAFQLNHSIPTA